MLEKEVEMQVHSHFDNSLSNIIMSLSTHSIHFKWISEITSWIDKGYWNWCSLYREIRIKISVYKT